MAEGKKSFIAYVDWKDTFYSLPDDKAGQLIKFLFAYVNDENPQTDDVLINAVFANIRQALKRDLRKYEQIREKRSLAGKASADKRQQVLTSVESVQQKATKSTVSVNVNDSGSDKDIKVRNIDINKNNYILWRDATPNGNYKLLIDFILGSNPTGEELIEVLKLKNQITEKKFNMLLELSRENKVKITEKLLDIEKNQRTVAPNKKQKDLMLTLVSWMNYKRKR